MTPKEIERLEKNVPYDLREWHVWLTWDEVPQPAGKPRKVPYYADGHTRSGKMDSAKDRARMVTFDEALKSAKKFKRKGVAVALGPIPDKNGLILSGIDVDGLVGPIKESDAYLAVRDISPTYFEISPSGNGFHVLGFNDIGRHEPDDSGLEIYSGKKFFTFTGNRLQGHKMFDLVGIAKRAREFFKVQPDPEPSPDGEDNSDLLDDDGDESDLIESQVWPLLEAIPASSYKTWIDVGQILKTDFGGYGGFGYKLWVKWSETCKAKFPGELECKKKWRTFGKNTDGPQLHVGTLVKMAGIPIPKLPATEDFKEPSLEVPEDAVITGGTPAGLKTTKFSEIEEKPIEFLVPDRIALGMLHCVAGYGGEGKSSCVTSMMARASRGLSPVSNEKLPGGPVTSALITEEPIGQQTRPRLRLAGANLDLILNVDGIVTKKGDLRAWNLIDHETRTREFLRARPDVKLLFIDPIGNYMNGEKREINTWKDSDVRIALSPWQKTAEEENVAIIYSAHHAKGKAERAMNLVTGSAAFTTVTRASYSVLDVPVGFIQEFGLEVGQFEDRKKVLGDRSRYKVLFPTKFNIGPEPAPIAYYFEHLADNRNPKVIPIGELPYTKAEDLMAMLHARDKAERQPTPLQDRILEFVTAHPGSPKNAIALGVGAVPNHSGTQAAFDSLERQGKIRIVKVTDTLSWVYSADVLDADLF